MGIEHNPPRIPLKDLRVRISNILFDNTSMKEIEYYNTEFRIYYLATMHEIPRERHKPIFHIFIKSVELLSKIPDLSQVNNDGFEVVKMKLLMIIDDFIQFVENNDIEVKYPYIKFRDS